MCVVQAKLVGCSLAFLFPSCKTTIYSTLICIKQSQKGNAQLETSEKDATAAHASPLTYYSQDAIVWCESCTEVIIFDSLAPFYSFVFTFGRSELTYIIYASLHSTHIYGKIHICACTHAHPIVSIFSQNCAFCKLLHARK
jgi:hypothetical protein